MAARNLTVQGQQRRQTLPRDPRLTLPVEKAAREHGLEVIGWYHSHPDHPARPSDFDREHAWPWYSYVIVSVMNGEPGDMTSWRLNDDRQNYSAEGIEIRNSALA